MNSSMYLYFIAVIDSRVMNSAVLHFFDIKVEETMEDEVEQQLCVNESHSYSSKLLGNK